MKGKKRGVWGHLRRRTVVENNKIVSMTDDTLKINPTGCFNNFCKLNLQIMVKF
jgi:hypothetical protein